MNTKVYYSDIGLNNKVISCKVTENKKHNDMITKENQTGKKLEEDLT